MRSSVQAVFTQRSEWSSVDFPRDTVRCGAVIRGENEDKVSRGAEKKPEKKPWLMRRNRGSRFHQPYNRRSVQYYLLFGCCQSVFFPT